jgi:Ca2+-transporting ATPase
LMLWLGFIGLVMGATTIGVIAWSDNHYDTAIARTMGMTSFAAANLLYSFCERDQLQSVFSLDVLRDRKFLYFSGASLLAIIIAPQLDLMNRILGTVPLTLHQWLICIVASFAAVVVSEVRKAILRRREHAPEGAAGETVNAAPVTSAS